MQCVFYGFFTPKEPEFGITEITKRLSLPKGTVHRYVKELVQEGFPRAKYFE